MKFVQVKIADFVEPTKSAIFACTNFTNCRFKFASFGNICIACPVLFKSVQNWTTQRFTITKKLNILKQTVSKKIMTRPANNGCRKDSFVPHAIIKQDFVGSTRDVTGKMAPFKMANVSNLEELLQSENGLLRKSVVYLVYLIHLLNICVERK